MAFAQKLTSQSVRNFTSMFSLAQEVVKPHLRLVAKPETPDQPHHFQSAAIAFGIPTQAKQKAAELQRLQKAMLAHFNKSLPQDAQLSALSLLPAAAFQNDLGRFLMLACEFYMASPENTCLTVSSAEAARHNGLMFMSADMPDGLKSSTLKKLQWLRDSVASDHQRTALSLRNGHINELLKSADRKLAYRQELQSIVQEVAIARCSAKAWSLHEQHFRATLQGL
jgi:hypothetical protein